MSSLTSKKLINLKLLAVLFFGFSSGLPLTLVGPTLQAWFTASNVSLMLIGSLTLIGLPYTFKFLWAPLMDYFQFTKLGKWQGWIILMQFSLAVAFLLLAQLNPLNHTYLILGIALFAAFFSASQDIAINAYQTDVLAPKERGLGSAYYVFAYRIALLVSGGFALIFADYMGWKITYELMGILCLLCIIPSYFSPKIQVIATSPKSIYDSFIGSLRNLLTQEKIIYLLFFIFFYKLGDAFAQALMTNFLLKGLGFSLTEIGIAYKTVSFIATILGAFIGGFLLTQWNVYQGLFYFGIAQAFSNLAFVALALVGKNFTFMAFAIFIEFFCSGLSTAAFFAFIMSVCNHRYTASQFALLSAIASLGRVFLGPIAAMVVLRVGWVQFYIYACLLCFPGLIFLLLLREKVKCYAIATAD